MPTSTPTEIRRIPMIRRYQTWLEQQRGLRFDSYDALWQWSVTDLNAF
jgi:acetoacetyl-CoA synthetase